MARPSPRQAQFPATQVTKARSWLSSKAKHDQRTDKMADMLSSVIGRRVPANVAEGESMRVRPRPVLPREAIYAA